ncbi:hypothetical protein [Petroclostridium sp. X23]|nr:hypothetical protein [Petroclostridium sp. X23]WHH59490.1 hypothetical protein QKW49_01600 [Petroclostridium sp. X23]
MEKTLKLIKNFKPAKANIYSHIDVDMKKNVATQMNKLFSNFTSVD